MQRQNYSATLERLKSYMAEPSSDTADDNEGTPFHDVDDTDRDFRSMPAMAFEPTGNESLDAVVRRASPRFAYGVPPSTQSSHKDIGDDGIINTPGIIGMPHRSQFNSDADYRAVLAHELVHWTKSRGMAPRPSGGITMLDQLIGYLPPDYPREELVAEMGAALLLDAVGEPQDLAARASYARGWASAIDEDKRDAAIDWASEKAQEAVSWLLDQNA